ncbi:AfsR/SARP family transcriptional regulator [Kribbella caucasensis]|uniref:AfsR/SARP family transcriptional regulator n=1 Tax=Kribbella caucasensis TaxID=2512215 RepID=UPI001414EBBC|nr:BTAD domain-containing putative transcriptional regulator [Kribbella sp. VKM Ac-2527]
MIELDGSRVETALPGKQGRLVFAYLAVNPRRPVPRDELMTALWPDALPPAASSSLSAVLSRLRRVLGPDRLAGRDSCELWLPSDTLVDVESALRFVHLAESMLAAGRYAEAWWAAATPMYVSARTFLPGHEGGWIDDWRRELEEVHLRAVEVYTTASLRIGGGEIVQAARLGRELVAEAPYRESGYRLLMKALAAQGNIAEALRVYEELRFRLADELGADPSPATQSVHRRLLNSDLLAE